LGNADSSRLKSRDGDRINAVLAAAGFYFSLLLRWFEKLFACLVIDLLSPYPRCSTLHIPALRKHSSPTTDYKRHRTTTLSAALEVASAGSRAAVSQLWSGY
jgi:hypothetical protein